MRGRSIANVVLSLSMVLGSAACSGDEPSSKSGPASTAPATRSYEAIQADLRKEYHAFNANKLTALEMADPAKRAAAAPKLIPIMKRAIGLLEELRNTEYPEGVIDAHREIPFFTELLAIFGDKDTLAQAEQESKGSPSMKSVSAKATLLIVQWVDAANDAAAQQKVLDDAKGLARDYPDNDHLTEVLSNMADVAPATQDLSRAAEAAAASMNTSMGQALKEQVEADQKLAVLENKPLTIDGNTVDGSHFSTADWKGKVILVDFWATWCPPCMEEMPRVIKAYADYHDKGLEVVGITSDHDPDELKQYLQQNKDVAWPQLFDPKELDWNPIAKSFGVESLPRMFLIDRKGVLRSVTALNDLEVQIPKLLAEKE